MTRWARNATDHGIRRDLLRSVAREVEASAELRALFAAVGEYLAAENGDGDLEALRNLESAHGRARRWLVAKEGGTDGAKPKG